MRLDLSGEVHDTIAGNLAFEVFDQDEGRSWLAEHADAPDVGVPIAPTVAELFAVAGVVPSHTEQPGAVGFTSGAPQ